MSRIKAAAVKLISLVCLAALILLAPSAAAAPPEELEPSYEEELLQERWKVEMENILRLFVDWSEYNGVYDGKGYCTTNGAPFNIATGDRCYIGYVSQAMKRAGLIDYTVAGGWSCNGFARFSLRALFGRSFWRSEMTEYVFTMTLYTGVDDVQDFLSKAKTGDVVCIMEYADHDNDGRVNDEYWHYMMFIEMCDEGILVLDGNFDHANGVQIHLVPWEFLMSRQWIYIYSVSDADYLSILDRPVEDFAPAKSVGGGERELLYQ